MSPRDPERQSESYYLRRVFAGSLAGYTLIAESIWGPMQADNIAAHTCPPPPMSLVQEAKGTIMKNGISTVADDREIATRLGVTLPKVQDRDFAHYDKLVNSSDAPFMEYFNETKAILAESGVTLRFGTEADLGNYPGEKVPILADFENPTSRNSLKALMQDLVTIPTDYFKWIGLKNAVLTTGHMEVAAYALTSGQHDTLHFDLEDQYTSEVFKHEAAHLADSVMCGGAEAAANDPNITALNHGVPYGLDDTSIKTHTQRTWLSAPIPHTIATAKDVVFTDPYGGQKDVIEDKAQDLSASQANGRLGLTSLNNMVIIDKMAVLYGRMLQPNNSPHVARFFLAMTQGQFNPYAPTSN